MGAKVLWQVLFKGQEEIQCDRNIVGVMGEVEEDGRADCVRPERSRALLDCILSRVGNQKGRLLHFTQPVWLLCGAQV